MFVWYILLLLSIQFGTQLNENLDAVTKLTDATKQIRKPVKSTLKERNIWKQLEAQNTAISLLQNDSAKVGEALEISRKRIKELEEENGKLLERFDYEYLRVQDSFVSLENDVSDEVRRLWKELRDSSDSNTTPSQVQ